MLSVFLFVSFLRYCPDLRNHNINIDGISFDLISAVTVIIIIITVTIILIITNNDNSNNNKRINEINNKEKVISYSVGCFK